MRFFPNPKSMYIIFCSLFFILTIFFVFVVFMFGRSSKVFFYNKHDKKKFAFAFFFVFISCFQVFQIIQGMLQPSML
jgi:hypothetical protein